jgi:hypothetical protein
LSDTLPQRHLSRIHLWQQLAGNFWRKRFEHSYKGFDSGNCAIKITENDSAHQIIPDADRLRF